jgi:hypothetical protein
MKKYSQAIIPNKKASNSIGFCPAEGQTHKRGTQQGAEIKYRACVVVLPKLRQHTQCWLTNQRLILLLISCQDTPKMGSGTKNFTAAPSIASLLAISFPRTPAYLGTQQSLTEWRVLL